ncbi:MAG: hypothetical protein OYM47_18485 [Gemmatimonadota bacterium]|nr:hypothetical protein [Gemmatimonadota bacterium]
MSRIEPASRLIRLSGARIGLLDPGKRTAGAVLNGVGERLAAEYDANVVGPWKKSSPYRVCTKKLVEEIVPQCDGLVMGVVD